MGGAHSGSVASPLGLLGYPLYWVTWFVAVGGRLAAAAAVLKAEVAA